MLIFIFSRTLKSDIDDFRERINFQVAEILKYSPSLEVVRNTRLFVIKRKKGGGGVFY